MTPQIDRPFTALVLELQRGLQRKDFGGLNEKYVRWMLNHNWLPREPWCAKIHAWLVTKRDEKHWRFPCEIPCLADFLELRRRQKGKNPLDDRTPAQRQRLNLPLDDTTRPPRTLQFLTSKANVLKAQLTVVEQAKHVLATTGSRARSPEYFAAIEKRLKDDPKLKYYRVLCAKAPHPSLADHLKRVMAIRKLEDYIDNDYHFVVGFVPIEAEPERFVTANDSQVLLPLPSINHHNDFDTALLISDAKYAEKYVQFVDAYYSVGRKYKNNAELERALSAWEKELKKVTPKPRK